MVEPFETEVIVVVTDPKLPAYGLPDDAVMAIPLSKNKSNRLESTDGREECKTSYYDDRLLCSQDYRK